MSDIRIEPNRGLIRLPLFIGLSILIAGIALYIYQEEIRNYRQNIAIEQAHHLENQTTLIREDFKHCAYALLFLSNQVRLHGLFTATASVDALGNNFVSFLESSKLYDQIRLLDIHGQEVLRILHQDSLNQHIRLKLQELELAVR